MKFTLLLAVSMIAIVSPVFADELVLADGSTLTGTIISQDRASLTIVTEDGERTIDRLMLTSINGAPPSVESPSRPERSDLPPARRGPEATDELLEWIDLCVSRLGSDDVGVRMGATAALRAAGDAAREKIERVAAEGDERAADSARKLLASLDRRATARPTAPRTSRAREDARAVANAARASGAELDLTSDQVWMFTRITSDFTRQETSLEAARRTGRLDAKQAEQQLNILKSRRDTKLSKLLSDEQMKKWREIERARAAR